MSSAKIWDLNEFTAMFFGFNIDSGMGGDSFLKVERESDAFTDSVGADGEVTRSKTNDKRVTLTLTLSQTSDFNSKLSAVAILDDAGTNGAGKGPFFLRDRSGNSVYGGECWIAKAPDPEFGKAATDREWKLRGILDVDFTGGS